eukprot:scaffold286954_cov22-Tisochrysis_lutea.AAC.1
MLQQHPGNLHLHEHPSRASVVLQCLWFCCALPPTLLKWHAVACHPHFSSGTLRKRHTSIDEGLERVRCPLRGAHWRRTKPAGAFAGLSCGQHLPQDGHMLGNVKTSSSAAYHRNSAPADQDMFCVRVS